MTERGNNPAAIAGTINAPESGVEGRGDSIKFAVGEWAIYVGTDAQGVEWLAHEPEDFRELCEDFDRKAAAA